MTLLRTLFSGVVLAVLVLQGCTKPPQALAVELLFDEVPALQDEGYSYVRAEELVGGFVVVAQQTEMPATPGTTPVFWVGKGRAHLVNRKAQSLAPDLETAPGILFDMLDPALFPEYMVDAFTELLEPPPAEDTAETVSTDSAERAPESP